MKNAPTKSIKDLIYFDLEKAKSLISQLNGGLISEISRAFEDESEVSTGAGFNFKVISASIGGKGREKSIRTEKSELYHELLNEIEKQLGENNLLSNINQAFESWEGSFNTFMDEVPKMSYIKANGWAVFEDSERFKVILSNFNDVQRLIFKSKLDSSEELKSFRKQIADLKKIANKNSDKNIKSKELFQIKSLEKKMDSFLESNTEANFIDEDFIDGVKTFLNTFTPGRLNLRLFPLELFNAFQILADIKEKYIIDGDFKSIIYTYGTRPNVKLTVLGIITSAPRQIDGRVDPNDEFLSITDNEMSESQIFDKAFRNMYLTFESFEKLFYVPGFPKISISPIAIYREVIFSNNVM